MKRTLSFLLLLIAAARGLAQDGDNLLANGGFEDGALGPWISYGDVTTEIVQDLTGAAVLETPVEGEQALRVTVETTPGNFWETGIIQDFPFEQGQVYTLSAFIKSAQGERTINFKPERGCCDFQGFGESQVTFGEEWTEFSVTTPEMATDEPEGQITFHIGFSEGTFWMDGIRFYEGEYVEPDFGPGNPLPRPCPISGSAEIDPEAVDGDAVIVTWRNGDVVPAGVDISRNGELIAESVDAASEEYLDEGVLPGAYTYELTFDVPGEVCDAVTMDVNSCISGLSASNRDEGVRLSWDNARVYDSIVILRNGEEIDDIPGDADEFTDDDAPLGLQTYEVVPSEGICDPAIIVFDVSDPVAEGENVLVNWGFEDGALEPWNTYGNVTVEIVDVLEGANVDEDPVEGLHALRIEIPEAGTNFWDAGFQQSYPFAGGAVYTLSAFVKSAEGERSINFKPERGCCGFAGFGESQFVFGEEWTEFSVTTPPMPEDVAEGQITFHVAFSAGVFWMDGVRFYEGEYVPPEFDDPPPPSRPEFLRGDADNSGAVNITDGVYVLNFLFAGGPGPGCEETGDADNSGATNITDGVYVLNFLFAGGPSPAPPGNVECGPDTDAIGSAGDLGCETPPPGCLP